MNRSASSSANAESPRYVMVPATAVDEDEDGSEECSRTSPACDRPPRPPAIAAHVLGVAEEEMGGPAAARGRSRASGYASLRVAAAGPPGSDAEDPEGEDEERARGAVLEPSWNDGWFAVAFLLNVVGTTLVAVFWGIPAVASDAQAAASGGSEQRGSSHPSSSGNSDSPSLANSTAAASSANRDGDEDDDDRMIEWFLILLSTAVAWSLVALALLIRASRTHATKFVRVAYFTAPCLFFASAAVLLTMKAMVGGDGHNVGLYLAASASAWAVVIVASWEPLQRTVPFASATLRVAADAVRPNLLWLAPLSVLSVLLGWAWFVLATLAFDACEGLPASDGTDASPSRPAAFLVCLFSIYWGCQVLKNVLHFTTAGAVRSWWFFDPRRAHLYSRHDGRRVVADSLCRASTYSLGSVCMASLLNAIAEAAEGLINSSRASCDCDATGLLACVLAFLLGCVGDALAYFNGFSLVYCALYNSDYLSSGRQVVRLFKYAGFTTFISDTLVFQVLFMAVLAVAALTGLTVVAAAAVLWTGRGVSFDANDLALMFLSGFMFGAFTSHPIMFLLESASRTIMVCLAEAPSHLSSSRPELFEILGEGWSAAYPEGWREQKAVPHR